jgi:hypothetical protein
MPIITQLNSSNPNRTLGCGYLDSTDNIFKQDGLTIKVINVNEVLCHAKHLTAFAVEEYTNENVDESKGGITEKPKAKVEPKGVLMESWAIYACTVIILIMSILLLWAYSKDKRDKIGYEEIRKEDYKLYVNVNLEYNEPPKPLIKKEKKKKPQAPLFMTAAEFEEAPKEEEVYEPIQETERLPTPPEEA